MLCCVIEGDFQAPNWLDLQRLHHNLREHRVRALPLLQRPAARAGRRRGGGNSSCSSLYSAGLTDASPLINKVKSSGANMLFPVSYLKST